MIMIQDYDERKLVPLAFLFWCQAPGTKLGFDGDTLPWTKARAATLVFGAIETTRTEQYTRSRLLYLEELFYVFFGAALRALQLTLYTNFLSSKIPPPAVHISPHDCQNFFL